MARADYGRASAAPRTIRCAIYTRKSTEDGLEQEFNSLDAQREACAAYVLSQRHEGWVLVPGFYDDGGFSGGSMERPGLRALLQEVAANRIDVIVVYKVDRLTRSLADFAKIVEILDAADASFVSVTQAFNTTTSMGRLTLNVLLSFAQFEREVTGERIRDKIAASKKKGMWMGGVVPLGYEVNDRKLVVNEKEAEQVRHIFERYLALGTVVALQEELAARGVLSKRRISASGRQTGGANFTHGALSHLIQNRIYVGEVHHRGQHYAGEHPPIINPELFERAQRQHDENRVARKHGRNIDDPSLLTGLLFDSAGRRMTPNHACKGSRRYRYYVSRPEPALSTEPLMRVPAGEVEKAIVEQLTTALAEPDLLHRLIKRCDREDVPIHQIRGMLDDLLSRLLHGRKAERRSLLATLLRRIDLHRDRLEVEARVPTLSDQTGGAALTEGACESLELPLTIPISTVRAGGEVRLLLPPSARASNRRHDPALITLVVKAGIARQALTSTPGISVDEAAAGMGLKVDYFRVLLRISFLAPDIVAAILEGRQPATLTRQYLARMTDLPLEWGEQRSKLGFAVELREAA
ncbi:MAG: recombinase family protein [Pseudomonadota bacterium]|nr:recombinase family protein [Pseudomonadota bacterium]